MTTELDLFRDYRRGIESAIHEQQQSELFKIKDRAGINQKLDMMISSLITYEKPVSVDYFFGLYGWSDRVCRAIVNASEGRIIATESGYILTANATPEQFDEANGRIYSQGRAMLRRALKERAVRHKIIGRSTREGCGINFAANV
jgi:hypothetical protein